MVEQVLRPTKQTWHTRCGAGQRNVWKWRRRKSSKRVEIIWRKSWSVEHRRGLILQWISECLARLEQVEWLHHQVRQEWEALRGPSQVDWYKKCIACSATRRRYNKKNGLVMEFFGFGASHQSRVIRWTQDSGEQCHLRFHDAQRHCALWLTLLCKDEASSSICTSGWRWKTGIIEGGDPALPMILRNQLLDPRWRSSDPRWWWPNKDWTQRKPSTMNWRSIVKHWQCSTKTLNDHLNVLHQVTEEGAPYNFKTGVTEDPGMSASQKWIAKVWRLLQFVNWIQRKHTVGESSWKHQDRVSKIPDNVTVENGPTERAMIPCTGKEKTFKEIELQLFNSSTVW